MVWSKAMKILYKDIDIFSFTVQHTEISSSVSVSCVLGISEVRKCRSVAVTSGSTERLNCRIYRQNSTHSPLRLLPASSLAKSLETTSLWMSKVGVNCSICLIVCSISFPLSETRRSERVPAADWIQEMIRCHVSSGAVCLSRLYGISDFSLKLLKHSKLLNGAFFQRTCQHAKLSLCTESVTGQWLSLRVLQEFTTSLLDCNTASKVATL